MSIEVGLVGLPNAGKSRIFNIFTRQNVPAENFPFCTIDPNVGVTTVDDPRLEQLASLIQPKNVRKISVNLIDIAGLVRGAHQGEGLGNQFLHHIRTVDGIAFVLRAFEDPSVSHVLGDVNPMRDYDILMTELLYADLASVQGSLEKVRKKNKVARSKEDLEFQRLLESLESWIAQEKPARTFEKTVNTEFEVYRMNLLTNKPAFLIINISEAELEVESEVSKLEKIILMFAEEQIPVVPFCVPIEEMLLNVSKEEREDIYRQYNLPMSGVELSGLIILKILNLITFFTAGENEVAAWAIKEGTTAKKAAEKIHSDIAQGFVKAEVVSFEDFISTGSFAKARAQGNLRLEGRDYIVKDGDIIHFRFNVA